MDYHDDAWEAIGRAGKRIAELEAELAACRSAGEQEIGEALNYYRAACRLPAAPYCYEVGKEPDTLARREVMAKVGALVRRADEAERTLKVAGWEQSKVSKYWHQPDCLALDIGDCSCSESVKATRQECGDRE